MSERAVGRPWSVQEDQLLVAAVKKHGENGRWKSIAVEVPDRTNKACRKRWLHSLSPSIKKSAWTPEEDHLLLHLYVKHNGKWSAIARGIEGRTDDACSKRYREALDPALKKEDWTEDEDSRLLQLAVTLKDQRNQVEWTAVGRVLQRGSLACRNRWKLLCRRKAAMPTELYPYYPPDSYPDILSSDSPGFSESFTFESQPLIIPSEVPPFQFSSSSLSSALSDPFSANPSPATSTVSLDSIDADLTSFPTPVQSPSPEPEDPPQLDPIFTEWRLDDTESPEIQIMNAEGDTYTTTVIPSPLSCFQQPFTSNTPLPIIHYQPPSPLSASAPSLESHYGDISSAASSPVDSLLPLTPTGSPSSNGSQDLPIVSIIMSTDFRGRGKLTRPARPLKARNSTTRPLGTSRLSSVMPMSSDESIRPYACGYRNCWPPDASESKSTFRTSKELFNHTRFDHMEEENETPFRCGLAGCGRSWKSLNGLQYHLQISTTHFRDALSNMISAAVESDESRGQSQDSISDALPSSQPKTQQKKPHTCPRENCYKVYQHLSGLRYHLQHGHPQQAPAQIKDVPPRLGNMLPTNIKKMRVKDASTAAGSNKV